MFYLGFICLFSQKSEHHHHQQLIGSKHDRVTCATKQIERDSKDTDATNYSYPEKCVACAI